jgi:hypothetical protein
MAKFKNKITWFCYGISFIIFLFIIAFTFLFFLSFTYSDYVYLYFLHIHDVNNIFQAIN